MSDEIEMSDEEVIMKIASQMKDSAPTQEDKANVHSFLQKVAEAPDNLKTGYLREDKEVNEIGYPEYHVRGLQDLGRISGLIMNNPYFESYFRGELQDVVASSLSREGFLIKQATTTTKQVADATKRRIIKKGWLGKENVQEQGGDINRIGS